MSIENISTLKNSSSVLSVTLHENNFTKDGTYYATVSRNTASFKNMLSEIAEDNKGMDPYMLQFAAILIQKKILKFLEQGKSVNVLDLGTMYIALKCNAKGKSDVAENGNFYIKFSPSSLANNALENLSVDKIVYADGRPEIKEVSDLSSGDLSCTVAGKPCKIRGSRLKLGGEGSGVLFAPVDSEGNASTDESTWIKVPKESVFRNKPTELNFFVPETLSAGSYKIVLRTAYLGKDKNRKTLVEAESSVVSVK